MSFYFIFYNKPTIKSIIRYQYITKYKITLQRSLTLGIFSFFSDPGSVEFIPKERRNENLQKKLTK